MRTVSEIMDQLGGIAKVSAATGFPFTTVHSWKRVGYVPEWRRPALLKMAKASGQSLSDADFPARPRPSEQSSAAAL